ncbi:MAG: shikimate dehydrogenase [Saprospiraceae bacterium]|nr:shikimate dehydrogenase [Saprospiraceae bacterium]
MIPTKTHKLGLIGYPLSHTFSPSYFAKKFEELGMPDCEYLAYSIETIDLVLGIFDKGVNGLNVTIPYKEQVLPFLDELSEEAFQINAVNTIKIENDGRRVGYNTDAYGFEVSLLNFLEGAKIEKALVLGTGGAAKAIKYVLKKMGIEITEVSRKPPFLTYAEMNQKVMDQHQLIINTTPLGMYPNEEVCPDIPYTMLTAKHFLYDLVYNPEKTLFLKKGELSGSKIKNGHDMLILQAEKSWEIWNQK